MEEKEKQKLKEITELLDNNKHWGNCAYDNFGIDEEVCCCKSFMLEEKERLSQSKATTSLQSNKSD